MNTESQPEEELPPEGEEEAQVEPLEPMLSAETPLSMEAGEPEAAEPPEQPLGEPPEQQLGEPPEQQPAEEPPPAEEPLGELPEQQPAEGPPLEEAPPAKRKHGAAYWVAIGVLIVVLVAAVVSGVILAGRFSGRQDIAAGAMPPDTTFYMGVNLLQLTPKNADRLLKPFLAQVPDAEFSDAEGMLTRLDESMQEEQGFNFSDDIRPWLGQYVGIGGTVDLGQGFQMTGQPELESAIIAVETRDKDASDAFLAKLRTAIEEEPASGDPRPENVEIFEEVEYQGVTIYYADARDTALARSGNLVLFANSLQEVKAAIDAQKGDSLRDDAQFKDLVRQLPRGRFLTLYTSGQGYSEMVGDLSSTGALASMSGLGMWEMMDGMGVSAAIVDEGLRIDSIVQYDADKLTDEIRTLLVTSSAAGEVQAAELVPADSFLLLAGRGLNKALEMNKAYLDASMGMDYAEAMQMLEQQIGLNPQTGLLAHLQGEFALALVPGEEGLLAQTGVPLGIIFISQVGDFEALSASLSSFNDRLQMQGLPVRETALGEGSVTVLGDPMMGGMVLYGLNPQALAIALSNTDIKSVLEPGDRLADDPEFKEVWTHFPRGTLPVFYLEVASLVEYLEEETLGFQGSGIEQTVDYLRPVDYLAMGGTPFENDQQHGVVIVFVDSVEDK